MAEKILNTRISLKCDTLENWNSSTIGLKKGELALATVAANAGTGLTEPVVMAKIGEDGTKTFKDLSWNFYAKASDVLAACKDEATLKTFINGVIADAGIASSDAMEALAGKVTAVEGRATTLEGEMDAAEGKITALEGLVGDTAVATQIGNAIATEKSRAEGIEAGLDGRIAAIEGDYLKTADKTALQNQIDLIMNNPDTENVINSINEFTQYITDHGEIAEGFRTDIDANADAIEAIEANYLKAADKTELQGNIDTLAGRVTTAEGEIDGLQADIATKAAQSDLDALEALVGDTAVATQITNAITDANLAQYAKASDLETTQGDLDTLEATVSGLAAIATSGNVNDLVQTAGDVLVFNCGTASTVI